MKTELTVRDEAI